MTSSQQSTKENLNKKDVLVTWELRTMNELYFTVPEKKKNDHTKEHIGSVGGEGESRGFRGINPGGFVIGKWVENLRSAV